MPAVSNRKEAIPITRIIIQVGKLSIKSTIVAFTSLLIGFVYAVDMDVSPSLLARLLLVTIQHRGSIGHN